MKPKQYTAWLLLFATLCMTMFTGCNVVETTGDLPINSPSYVETSGNTVSMEETIKLPYTSIPELDFDQFPVDSSGSLICPYGLYAYDKEYAERISTSGIKVPDGMVCMTLKEFDNYGGMFKGEPYTCTKGGFIKVESFYELSNKILNLDFTDEEIAIMNDSFLYRYNAAMFVIPNPFILSEFDISLPEEWGEPTYTWNPFSCKISFENTTITYQFPSVIEETLPRTLINSTIDDLAKMYGNGEYEESEYNGMPAFKIFTKNKKVSYYAQEYTVEGQTYHVLFALNSAGNVVVGEVYWYTQWNDVLLSITNAWNLDEANMNDFLSAVYDIRVSSKQE